MRRPRKKLLPIDYIPYYIRIEVCGPSSMSGKIKQFLSEEVQEIHWSPSYIHLSDQPSNRGLYQENAGEMIKKREMKKEKIDIKGVGWMIEMHNIYPCHLIKKDY